MPPVADTFIEAVERLVGQRGLTWGALFRRLEEISGTKAASWKRSFGRYRNGELAPEEDTAALIARALEVPRSSLPTVPKVSRKALEPRLAALERQVGAIPGGVGVIAGSLSTRLAELEAQVVRLTGIVEVLSPADSQAGPGARRGTGR